MAELPTINLALYARTDVGMARSGNEDNFLILDLSTGRSWTASEEEPPDLLTYSQGYYGSLLAVSDGMGGALAGEVASRMAVETVRDRMLQLQAHEVYGRVPFHERLRLSIEAANLLINGESRNNPAHKGLGATFTAVATHGNQVFFAQVGDSRAYLIRQGRIYRITKDQTLVQQLSDAGQITEEEGETHSYRNVILQALGAHSNVNVEVSSLSLCNLDRLVLCSDGLSGKVSQGEIARVVREASDSKSACQRLIDLAKDGGGEDNITVVVAQFSGSGLTLPANDSIEPQSLARSPGTPAEINWGAGATTKIEGDPGVAAAQEAGPTAAQKHSSRAEPLEARHTQPLSAQNSQIFTKEMNRMDNLTMTEKVLRQHTGLDPLEGYALVVYEQLGESGAEFRGVIEPGQRFQKAKPGFLGLRPAPNYFAFAVNLAPELPLHFSDHITLDDQIHDLDLSFDLSYCVSNPKTLATMRNQDPLRRVRDEIVRAIKRRFGQAEWEEVRDQYQFRRLEREALDATQSHLSEYAQRLGLRILSIALNRRLPERSLETVLDEETAESKIRKAEIEQRVARQELQEIYKTEKLKRDQQRIIDKEEEAYQHQQREKHLDNQLALQQKEDAAHRIAMSRQIRESQTNAISTAFEKVGQSIESPQDLYEAARAVQEIQALTSSPPGSATPGSANFPAALSSPTAGYLSSGEVGLPYLLSQLLAEISRWGYPFEQKQALLSAILHLIAELLLDDRGDEKSLRLYSGKIATLMKEMKPPLSARQFKFLEQFINYDQIRDQLI